MSRTLFPAEAGLAQNPELMVVKVDLSPRGQEGVGQLTVQTIKTRMQRRPPAIRVIVRVESCKHVRGLASNTQNADQTETRCNGTSRLYAQCLGSFPDGLPIVMSALLLRSVISVKVRGETSLHLVKAILIALRVSSLFSVLGNFVILGDRKHKL